MKRLIRLARGHKLAVAVAVLAVLMTGMAGLGELVRASPPALRNFYCGFTELGRQGCHAMLSNRDLYNTNPFDSTTVAGNVLLYDPSDPGGDALPPSTVNSVASFESTYKAYLSSGSPTNYSYDSLGAAATIEAMLGATGPEVCSWYKPGATTCDWSAAIAYAQDPAHLDDWISRVNYYAAQGWITWNKTMYLGVGEPHGGHACTADGNACWTPGVRNPPMLPSADARDVVMVGEDAYGAGTISIISFNNPDGSHFILNRLCGNFEGQLSALEIPPSSDVSCAGMVTSVPSADPNQPFALRVSVKYTPASGAETAFGPDAIAVSLDGPSPYGGFRRTVRNPSVVGDTVTAAVNVPATRVGGVYTVTWKVTGPQAPTISCPASLTIAYKPFFDVLGGDISAGQGFGSNCIADPAADIKGYSLDSGGSPANYFGAGSSQAALATGGITGFASDMTNNYPSNLGDSSDGISAHLPAGLTVANTGSPTAPAYGGQLLGTYAGNWCVPDYAGSVTTTADYTSVPNWRSLSPGDYIIRLSGDSQLGSIRLRPGVHVTIVDTGGSVYLTGNVTYAGYSSLTDIPQFSLLVSGGNIFIDPDVTELHGFYDAQPTGADTGAIYTCATGDSITNVIKDYSRCGQALTIYGAVAARQIVFDRTGGDIASSDVVSDTPAEHIIYTPELWLSDIRGPSVSCAQNPAQNQCLFQMYTSLPPVL